MKRDTIWAVIPFKGFAGAKQRLSPAFSARERSTLAGLMLEDVLDALLRVTELDGIVLVTRDEAAAEIARERQVEVHVERATSDHSQAVLEAAYALAARSVTGILALPADIPGIQSDEVSHLVTCHRTSGCAITIAPSLDRRGSNAIAMTPAGVLPLQYGEDSFERHLNSASQLGLRISVVELPGLALDLDTPEDCELFLSRSVSMTRTHRFLRRWHAARSCASKYSESKIPKHDCECF